MIKMQSAVDGASRLAVFRALADENRLRVMEVLRRGEHCVCDLQSSLNMGQSLLSHHLKALREAGLVQSRKDGRWVHYSLVTDVLEELGAYFAGVREDAATAPPRPTKC